MKKAVLLVAFFCLLISFSFAQKVSGVVKGSLRDSSSNQGLSDATVSVITQKDSALLSFTLTSNSGFFEIRNLDTGAYVLLISYQGYPSIQKAFRITPQQPVKDFGTIRADQEYKQLSEVVVNSQPPIQVKGDTIAYRADAFKTKPNASVEELLKKLPGVQVERDGTLKAQGENVQKVYVDGKEFFGNDPKLATKNLTADMVEQVEVYDDASEQAKFTGIDDGNRSKAINLKLKKDKNKGLFGRASAGYGTNNRYEGGLAANYFKGATKVSVIARANNTNSIGFTPTDMMSDFGGRGGNNMGAQNNTGSGSGITRNWTAGANYSDLWGRDLELTGSYFYNNTNNTNNRNSYRQTFFPDSTVIRSQQTVSENNNKNHRLNLRLTYTIDSLNSIVYTPNLSIQNSGSFNSDTTESFALENGSRFKVNDSRSQRTNSGEGYSWNNNLLYRRRFAKRGRTFSINLTNTLGSTGRNGSSDSRIGLYHSGIKLKDSTINQISRQQNETNNYGVSLSYTEPLAQDKMLELHYSYNNNTNSSDRLVYDLNDASGKYDLINVQQTNNFQNRNESNRFGTNFRVVKKKYNYQVGIAVQHTGLHSNNLSKNTLMEQTFTNLFPSASFNYQFARAKSLRFDYRGRTNQPSVSQLQPIRDVSNPLYQTEGNPLLKQEYTNNFSLHYNFFDMRKFRNFFIRLAFSNTYNKIVNSIENTGKGVQLSRPVNAGGAYNASGIFTIGFPLNRMRNGNINTNTVINYNRDVSLADGIKNYTKNLVLSETVRLNYNYKENLDLGISAGITYNSARYTLNRARNNAYYTHTYSADASYVFPKNFILSTDLDYTTNTGLAAGFNQSYFLWNASLAKQFLKNNRGELKLSVSDILKQNRSVTRNVADNYIEDLQNSVLQRYFLLTFTYNLNRMGGGSNSRMQMGRERNFRMR